MKRSKISFMLALLCAFTLGSCTNSDSNSSESVDTSALKGKDGVGIVSIEKTSTEGNVDTYTITYNDGTTTTFTVTNGTDGEQGIQGEKGADGHTPSITIGSNGNWFIDGVDTGVAATGTAGEQGEKGEQGDPGTDGQDGKDGTSLHTGNGAPADALGQDGDSYIDLDTWDFYVKADGVWTNAGNIKGTNGSDGSDGSNGSNGSDGSDGTSIRTGNGAPADALGQDGDSYIDLDTWDFYVKANGVWTNAGNIKGQDGTNGSNGENASHYNESFTVTFHLNGGTLPAGYSKTASVLWGETVDLPVPTYYGHTFSGWFTGTTANDRQFYSVDAVFADLDLYAFYDTGTYTVTLDLNGGIYEGETTLSYAYGDAYSLPTEVSKDGFKFLGWSLDGELIANSGTFVYENITLVATYSEILQYTIYLNLNGGRYDGSTYITLKPSETYTLPYEGVTYGTKVLAGWYQDDTLWEYTGTFELEENVTLVAKWEDLTTYSISFDMNGGSVNQDMPSQITNKEIYEGATFVTPTKSGYSFFAYYRGHTKITNELGEIDLAALASSTKYTLTAKYMGADDNHIGDFIYMGEYPQTLVTDEATISELTLSSDTDGDGYINYGETEYAKMSGKGYNGYSASETYYFKVEPLLWAVNSDGVTICDKIIDAMPFFDGAQEARNLGDGLNVWPNNYKASNIRAYLNGLDGTSYEVPNYQGSGFIDVAFTKEEESKILLTNVDNSLTSTGSTSTNYYLCDNTDDFIYILSTADLTNTAYGYSDSNYASQERIKYITDYAIYQGTSSYISSTKAGSWTLRSPRSNNTNGYWTSMTSSSGTISSVTVETTCGIVPAFTISL